MKDYRNYSDFNGVEAELERMEIGVNEVDSIVRERLEIEGVDHLLTSEIIDAALNNYFFSTDSPNEEEIINYASKLDLTVDTFREKNMQLVEMHGGEDMDEDKWIILKVIIEEKPIYIKYNGHYDSWDGSNWFDLNHAKIVYPKEIKKVIFE